MQRIELDVRHAESPRDLGRERRLARSAAARDRDSRSAR